MKAHTCHRMPGEAMNSPVMMATFICTQNASPGAVKISVWLRLVMGRDSQSTMRSAKGKAITRPTSSAMSERTMRMRSSPRCSMNGILSSTERAMPTSR
jgi:hypothetical protein